MLLVLPKCSNVPLTPCIHEQDVAKKALNAKMVDPQKLTVDLSKRWEERAAPLLLKQPLPVFCQTSAESAVSVDIPTNDAISVPQYWRALLSLGRKTEKPQAIPIALPVHATAISMPGMEDLDSAIQPAEPITGAIGTAMISDMPATTMIATGTTDGDGTITLNVAHSSEGRHAAANQLQPVTEANEGARALSTQKDRNGLQLVTEGSTMSLSARYLLNLSYAHICSLSGVVADIIEILR